MGRWGDGIYESDSALDFFGMFVEERIKREMALLTSPEQVKHTEQWLVQVLSVIEVILLFHEHRIGSVVCLWEQEKLVKRWRNTVLKVWDSEWNDNGHCRFLYSQQTQRKKYRHVIVDLFQRLDDIVELLGDTTEVVDPYKYPIPYFSIDSGWFAGTLIEDLTINTVFVLSEENRKRAIDLFYIEHVFVAVNIIAFLCETYNVSPDVEAKFVHKWFKQTTEIWKIRDEEEDWTFLAFEEDRALYQNVKRDFDRLRAVAEKYPPLF